MGTRQERKRLMLASCLHKANAVLPNAWVWDSVFAAWSSVCWFGWDLGRQLTRNRYPVRARGRRSKKIEKEVHVRTI